MSVKVSEPQVSRTTSREIRAYLVVADCVELFLEGIFRRPRDLENRFNLEFVLHMGRRVRGFYVSAQYDLK